MGVSPTCARQLDHDESPADDTRPAATVDTLRPHFRRRTVVCPLVPLFLVPFVTDAGAVREILSHLGEPTSPPRLMGARAPPLREMQGATMGKDEAQPQPVPDYEYHQRTAW